MFLLDSNVYIAGFNDAAFGVGFRAFHRTHLPRIVLSAVVMHELLVGARDRRRERLLRRAIIQPFRTRRRIHVPGARTWELAAELHRRPRALGGVEAGPGPRRLADDPLTPARPPEPSATMLTRN